MSLNPNKTIISPKEKILEDYLLAVQSREISLLGRKEVFMGKAKFGIFGDGKEVAQIVFSKMFKKGDWRSGYYRDQTLMMMILMMMMTINTFSTRLRKTQILLSYLEGYHYDIQPSEKKTKRL